MKNYTIPTIKFSIFFIFFVLSFPTLSETLVLSMSLEKYNREGFEITELVREGDGTFYEKENERYYVILNLVPLFPMTNDNWMVNWGTLTIK